MRDGWTIPAEWLTSVTLHTKWRGRTSNVTREWCTWKLYIKIERCEAFEVARIRLVVPIDMKGDKKKSLYIKIKQVVVGSRSVVFTNGPACWMLVGL